MPEPQGNLAFDHQDTNLGHVDKLRHRQYAGPSHSRGGGFPAPHSDSVSAIPQGQGVVVVAG